MSIDLKCTNVENEQIKVLCENSDAQENLDGEAEGESDERLPFFQRQLNRLRSFWRGIFSKRKIHRYRRVNPGAGIKMSGLPKTSKDVKSNKTNRAIETLPKENPSSMTLAALMKQEFSVGNKGLRNSIANFERKSASIKMVTEANERERLEELKNRYNLSKSNPTAIFENPEFHVPGFTPKPHPGRLPQADSSPEIQNSAKE